MLGHKDNSKLRKLLSKQKTRTSLQVFAHVLENAHHALGGELILRLPPVSILPCSGRNLHLLADTSAGSLSQSLHPSPKCPNLLLVFSLAVLPRRSTNHACHSRLTTPDTDVHFSTSLLEVAPNQTRTVSHWEVLLAAFFVEIKTHRLGRRVPCRGTVPFVFMRMRLRDPHCCGRDPCLRQPRLFEREKRSQRTGFGPVPSPTSPRSLNFGLARRAGLGTDTTRSARPPVFVPLGAAFFFRH